MDTTYFSRTFGVMLHQAKYSIASLSKKKLTEIILMDIGVLRNVEL